MDPELHLLIDFTSPTFTPSETCFFRATTRVALHRDRDFFKAFIDGETVVAGLAWLRPVPEEVSVIVMETTDCQQRVTRDGWGDPLTYCFAKDMAAFLAVCSELSLWNKAVLAFLQAMPAETPIVLWWC